MNDKFMRAAFDEDDDDDDDDTVATATSRDNV